MTKNLFVANNVWDNLSKASKLDLESCETYNDCLEEAKYHDLLVFKDNMENVYIQKTNETFNEFKMVAKIC